MLLRPALVLAACFALGLPAAAQEDASAAPAQLEPDREPSRSEKTLESLSKLLARRAELTAEIAAMDSQDGQDGSGAGGSEDSATVRDHATQERAAIDAQVEVLAAGVSEAEFRGDGDTQFDLNTEVQGLLEPFVAVLKDATENAREIERLRRGIGAAQRRQQVARGALNSLEPLMAAATGDVRLESELRDLKDQWERRARSAADLAESLRRQLEARLENRGATEAAANEAASSFFRDRGLSLLFGVAAFTAVLVILRLLHRVIVRVRGGDRRGRSFQKRLFDLVFAIATVLFATVAMMAVFNSRHDWLLLGVASLLLLTTAWVALKLVPGMIEQVTLLLNLGAVQEGERVLFEGVPYRVKRLDFYTDLENPLLDGAKITLPVRTLCGLHSRSSGDHEPWFPTSAGDIVMLADGTRGKVVSQSPEHVEIEVPGGSHVTYSTPDFLAEKPKNLSLGYRAEVTFGISYGHQAASTGEIIETLRDHVRKGMLALVSEEHLKGVSIELMEAADSAIVYEVEADLDGAVAHRMEEFERELVRLCVDACNHNGWEIPFPQLVVHGMGS